MNPPHTDALLQRMQLLIAQGELDTALDDCNYVLNHNPQHVIALVQRGKLLIMLGRYREALACEDRALALAPNLPDAHSFRGTALYWLGHIEEALHAYDRLIELAPNAAVGHHNRGNVLRKLRRYDEALASLERAMQLKPVYPDAHTSIALVLDAMGDRQAAYQHYEAALQLAPRAADAHYNLALALLSDGDLGRGWQEYEWRLIWDVSARQGQSRAIGYVAPDWNGKSIAAPLLILPEQGLGDQIFYAGMLADLEAMQPGSIVCIEGRLVPLLARSFPGLTFVDAVSFDVEACRATGAIGAQIHIASLGKIFRADTRGLEAVRQGYLKPDTQRRDELRTRLRAGGGLVCGLSWVSKNVEQGQDKSLMLETLQPLLAMPGVQFVDLQYGDTSAERTELMARHGLSITRLDDIDNLRDIDGLASLIDACDIVVTVSNTTAHLACAIGKPTLVMLPATPALFWYWHRNRMDSPWYPSACLLRQSTPGQWHDVAGAAAAIVGQLAQEYGR